MTGEGGTVVSEGARAGYAPVARPVPPRRAALDAAHKAQVKATADAPPPPAEATLAMEPPATTAEPIATAAVAAKPAVLRVTHRPASAKPAPKAIPVGVVRTRASQRQAAKVLRTIEAHLDRLLAINTEELGGSVLLSIDDLTRNATDLRVKGMRWWINQRNGQPLMQVNTDKGLSQGRLVMTVPEDDAEIVATDNSLEFAVSYQGATRIRFQAANGLESESELLDMLQRRRDAKQCAEKAADVVVDMVDEVPVQHRPSMVEAAVIWMLAHQYTRAQAADALGVRMDFIKRCLRARNSRILDKGCDPVEDLMEQAVQQRFSNRSAAAMKKDLAALGLRMDELLETLSAATAIGSRRQFVDGEGIFRSPTKLPSPIRLTVCVATGADGQPELAQARLRRIEGSWAVRLIRDASRYCVVSGASQLELPPAESRKASDLEFSILQQWLKETDPKLAREFTRNDARRVQWLLFADGTEGVAFSSDKRPLAGVIAFGTNPDDGTTRADLLKWRAL